MGGGNGERRKRDRGRDGNRLIASLIFNAQSNVKV